MSSQANDIATYGEDRTNEEDLFNSSDDGSDELYRDDGYRQPETRITAMGLDQQDSESQAQNDDQLKEVDESEVDLLDRLHESDDQDEGPKAENLGDALAGLESDSEASDADDEQEDGDVEDRDAETEHEAPLPSTLEDAVEDENGVENEVKSTWSDDSTLSDEDGYMSVAADCIARRNLGKGVAGEIDGSDTEEGQEDATTGIIDDYSYEDAQEDAGRCDADVDAEESDSGCWSGWRTPPPEERYHVNDETKPWLSNAHVNGSILPIGCIGEDDMYRRDVEFFNTGKVLLHKYTDPNQKSHGKPSLLNPDGALTRARFDRHEARVERDRALYEYEILEGDLNAANAELRESQEQVGILKHAVASRQVSLEASSEKLDKFRGYVESWKGHAEHWKSAFEKQRPLADAERERLAMIEAGIENRRSTETQTSPIEALSHDSTPEKRTQDADAQTSPIEALSQQDTEYIRPRYISMQTEIADLANLVHETDRDITRHRDDVLQQNEEITALAAQTVRLKKLLEDSKEWIEARDWVLKNSRDLKEQGIVDESPQELDEALTASALFSPRGEVAPIDFELPPDSTMLGWPESWIEREEEMRRSASWIKNRDKVAAELDAWERQYLANANTSTNAMACA